MLGRVAAQLRYRRAMRKMAVPGTPDSAYFSRFGGLWTDRRDAGQEIERRAQEGRISAPLAERLRFWVSNGYVVLEQAVDGGVCDQVRADLQAAFRDGDERLLIHSPAGANYRPLSAGLDTERARVVDAYVYYESARRALFSPAIIEFLSAVFDDRVLLFQSLSFERGSQQPLHQDTAFVVVDSPLELAASWIALEDIQPGSGELTYLAGSHRLPEYLFSGAFKHWNPKRDGQDQHDAWERLMHQNAERLGLERQTFLPRKGDVLIWAADLAHGGSAVADPALTRRSLVGHYCPARVEPVYFKVEPGRRARVLVEGGGYASQHYPVSGGSSGQ
jgi:ectoine hydroxylase-related dioxygenase (phytanoyl-CoA dioxygenase family)